MASAGEAEALFTGSAVRSRNHRSCVRWYLRYKLSTRNLVEMMAERGVVLETQHGCNTELHSAMILLNGLITNDKFCLVLVSPSKLRWVRGPRSGVGTLADPLNLPEDKKNSLGGGYAKEVADSPSVATDAGCGAALRSNLPASPGVDPAGRPEQQSAASVVRRNRLGDER